MIQVEQEKITEDSKTWDFKMTDQMVKMVQIWALQARKRLLKEAQVEDTSK